MISAHFRAPPAKVDHLALRSDIIQAPVAADVSSTQDHSSVCSVSCKDSCSCKNSALLRRRDNLIALEPALAAGGVFDPDPAALGVVRDETDFAPVMQVVERF